MKCHYRLAVTCAALALTACTPDQIKAFVAWHEADPAGAEAWLASDEGQATLNDSDGPQFQVYEERNVAGGRWDKIAMCESGANWHHPPVTNSTGTYSGGLMIWQKAWVTYGGTEFAPWAYLASKAEQIEVAERILSDRGWGAWDCA